MSDFKAKMHQIQFRLGSDPDPTGGAYSAPPNPPAGFKGPTSKGEEGKEMDGEWESGTGGEKKGRGGMRGEGKREREGTPKVCFTP